MTAAWRSPKGTCMEILSRMTAASIRLLPADPPTPRSARIPRDRARRWRSPLEGLPDDGETLEGEPFSGGMSNNAPFDNG